MVVIDTSEFLVNKDEIPFLFFIFSEGLGDRKSVV